MNQKIYIQDAIVLEKNIISEDYFTIKVKLLENSITKGINIEPGQFAHISIINSLCNFNIRRPFSIMDYDDEGNLYFFIKKIGKITSYLFNNENIKINLIFPLGNYFNFNKTNTNNFLLVAGGSGIAPILFLAKMMYKKNLNYNVLIGLQNSKLIDFLNSFIFLKDKLFISTEDGSFGEKCLVSEHSLLKNIRNFDKIFICGPKEMIKKIALIANKNNVECEFSLENYMLCGIGVCLGCIQKTKDGFKCVCTNGPIFNSNYIIW